MGKLTAIEGGICMTAIEVLLKMIDEAFDHRSWHGTNLRGAIRGMTAATAAFRIAHDRHNIWEHVLHAAYWKYTVRRRLCGEKRGSFPLKGSNWFERPMSEKSVETDSNDETLWKADVKLLVDTHESLRAAIAALKPSELDTPAAGGETTILSLVTGIAAHDLYHAGQIQLIKRLFANQ
ncbi:MAG: DinB family protein [Planctomyces sp.]|nr:DinB family protein [Planctomyces sp.]